ncbi:hypothetical protein [Pseudomonas mucidolens]|uniref:hypothetical protein n=1 Tax=Pseudomonas mucidolens TaxID=46679 RepID=UPI0030D95959
MTLAWYTKRPAPVFMIVFYCFILLVQSGLWLVNEGLEQAWQGDISLLVLLCACSVTLLMFVGALMLAGKNRATRGVLFWPWHWA